MTETTEKTETPEMTTAQQRIRPMTFHAAEGTGDWRVLGEGACAYFRTTSFADGVRLVTAIGEAVAAVGETATPGVGAPDVDLRPEGVTVRLIETAGFYGLTEQHVDTARRISAAARALGAVAEPWAVQTVQVTVDALERPAVVAFWRALLGYRDRAGSDEDLLDPARRGAPFYFQQMDEPRPQRNRVHVDVWVPHDQAEARIAAAVAAGGRLVTDEHAPNHWVLADPEGNEACVGAAGAAG
ncbi:VOC family protein [Kitasatospora sp. NPDC049285]|uniref:VOC family protein n=1 Tax=Kitasatospora sp. NPDC049285 TaxID=3157096 RepID=UPI0034211F73